MLIEHGFPIVLIPRPQNMVVGSGDNPDCIELHEAQIVNDPYEIKRAGRCRCEALGAQPKATCVLIPNS